MISSSNDTKSYLSSKSSTIQVISAVKNRVSASPCTTKFWTLKTLLEWLRNQILAQNGTSGKIWVGGLAAVKFDSSSAHFREIWKMSILSRKFQSFQNRPEMRSDEMFGFPTRLGWKKTIYFEKFDFRLFWKISHDRLPIAPYRGFWRLDSIFALWKCYEFMP